MPEPPILHKRHYDFLADALKKAREKVITREQLQGVHFVIQELAQALEKTNPLFRKQTFLKRALEGEPQKVGS